MKNVKFRLMLAVVMVTVGTCLAPFSLAYVLAATGCGLVNLLLLKLGRTRTSADYFELLATALTFGGPIIAAQYIFPAKLWDPALVAQFIGITLLGHNVGKLLFPRPEIKSQP